MWELLCAFYWNWFARRLLVRLQAPGSVSKARNMGNLKRSRHDAPFSLLRNSCVIYVSFFRVFFRLFQSSFSRRLLVGLRSSSSHCKHCNIGNWLRRPKVLFHTNVISISSQESFLLYVFHIEDMKRTSSMVGCQLVDAFAFFRCKFMRRAA